MIKANNRRRVFMVLLTLFISLLTSCGYKDIDKRFFVVSIGIDKNENKNENESKKDIPKYNVQLKLAIPQADIKAGQEGVILVEEQANSITEAVNRVKAKVDKKLDFSHAKVIMLGEPVVREGEMNNLIDWFIRRRDIQKIAWVAIGRPDAKTILDLKPKSERLPSNALFLSFGQSGTESSYIISEYLFSFRKRLTERGLDPILPIIEVKEPALFAINKSAVFNKQRMVEELTPEETKLFNIITNKVKEAEIGTKQDKDGGLFIMIDQAKTKYKIETASGSTQPKVKVIIKLEGTIEETPEEITKADLNKYLEKVEEQFKQQTIKLLTKLQKKEIDPLGLGLMYRGTHSYQKDWQEWEEIHPRLEFEPVVNVTVEGGGDLR